MDNAVMVTTGKIFKHYYVDIHLHRDINIRQIISIECKDKESQKELFDYINHKYDDLRFGDITNLKVANEIIGDQRKTIKELEKENNELKTELFESEFDYYKETYHDNPIRADDRILELKKEFKERFGRDFEYGEK